MGEFKDKIAGHANELAGKAMRAVCSTSPISTRT